MQYAQRTYADIVMHTLRPDQWTSRSELNGHIIRERGKMSPGVLTNTLAALVRAGRIAHDDRRLLYSLKATEIGDGDAGDQQRAVQALLRDARAPATCANGAVVSEERRPEDTSAVAAAAATTTLAPVDDAGDDFGATLPVARASRTKRKRKSTARIDDDDGGDDDVYGDGAHTYDNDRRKARFRKLLLARVDQLEGRVEAIENELRQSRRQRERERQREARQQRQKVQRGGGNGGARQRSSTHRTTKRGHYRQATLGDDDAAATSAAATAAAAAAAISVDSDSGDGGSPQSHRLRADGGRGRGIGGGISGGGGARTRCDDIEQPPHRAHAAALPEAFANMVRASGVDGVSARVVWCVKQQSVDGAEWHALPKEISAAVQSAYERYVFVDRTQHTYTDARYGLSVQFVGMLGTYNRRDVRFLRR